MKNDTLELLTDEIEGQAHKKVLHINLKEKTIQEAYNLLNYEIINFEILDEKEEIIKVSTNGYILLDAIVKALREQILHNERKNIINNILKSATLQEANK